MRNQKIFRKPKKELKGTKQKDFHFLNECEIREKILEEDWIIQRCTFDKKVIFKDCTFQKGFKIWSSVFRESLEFVDCIFESTVRLEDNHLHGNFSFGSCTFEKRFSILKGQVFGDSSFIDLYFRDRVLFRGFDFCRGVQFSSSTFKEEAIFDGANQNDMFLGETFFTDISLSLFEKNLSFRNVSMEWVSFRNIDIDRMNLILVKWRKPLLSFYRNHSKRSRKKKEIYEENRNLLFDEWRKFHKTPEGQELEIHKTPEWLDLQRQYRLLRLHYESKNNFEEADRFYTSEMEVRRVVFEMGVELENSKGLQQGNSEKIPSKILKTIVRFFRKWNVIRFYRWISEYGTNYLRPILWLFCFILFSAWIYKSIFFVFCESSLTWSTQWSETLAYTFKAGLFRINLTTPCTVQGWGKAFLSFWNVTQLTFTVLFSALALLAFRRRLKR